MVYAVYDKMRMDMVTVFVCGYDHLIAFKTLFRKLFRHGMSFLWRYRFLWRKALHEMIIFSTALLSPYLFCRFHFINGSLRIAVLATYKLFLGLFVVGDIVY